MDAKYDKNYRLVVSDLLKSLRENKKYTLNDVSSYINISRNTYYCYENGTRDISEKAYYSLCKLYDLNSKQTFKEIHEKALEKTLVEL